MAGAVPKFSATLLADQLKHRIQVAANIIYCALAIKQRGRHRLRQRQRGEEVLLALARDLKRERIARAGRAHDFVRAMHRALRRDRETGFEQSHLRPERHGRLHPWVEEKDLGSHLLCLGDVRVISERFAHARCSFIAIHARIDKVLPKRD